jgi:hypothetical protein
MTYSAWLLNSALYGNITEQYGIQMEGLLRTNGIKTTAVQYA